MEPIRVALITGIAGQDGSYLAEFLLRHPKINYRVVGIARAATSSSSDNLKTLTKAPLADRVDIFYGDILDFAFVASVLLRTQPHEIYNLAAVSHVGISFAEPLQSSMVTTQGTLNLIECVRILGLGPRVRMMQASSSEMFGNLKIVSHYHIRFPVVLFCLHSSQLIIQSSI